MPSDRHYGRCTYATLGSLRGQRLRPLHGGDPTPDGECAVLSTDVEETAASLDNYRPGDGDAWREEFEAMQVVAERV